MGIKITLSSVQFLTKPVMEHQFNVINDFAEEITFRNFLQDNQRTLIDRLAIQLEIDGAYNLVFLQWRMQLGAVQDVAGFEILHTTAWNGQVQIFIHAKGGTVVVAEPDGFGSKLFTCFQWVYGFEETEAPVSSFLLSVSRPLKVRPPITAEIRRI